MPWPGPPAPKIERGRLLARQLARYFKPDKSDSPIPCACNAGDGCREISCHHFWNWFLSLEEKEIDKMLRLYFVAVEE